MLKKVSIPFSCLFSLHRQPGNQSISLTKDNRIIDRIIDLNAALHVYTGNTHRLEQCILSRIPFAPKILMLVPSLRGHSWIQHEKRTLSTHILTPYYYYTAIQRQKGIADNFVKIELSPLPGPEWQYLSVQNHKIPYFRLISPKNISSKNEFYVQVNRSQAQ